MERILFSVFCAIVVAFFVAIYFAGRSWGKMTPGKRIVSLLLLVPHFLLIACVAVSTLYGHPHQGSPAFNTQFFCGVLVMFILPLPAFVGTVSALVMFRRAQLGV